MLTTINTQIPQVCESTSEHRELPKHSPPQLVWGMCPQEFVSDNCTAAYGDMDIAFVQEPELPPKQLSWVPCVCKRSTIRGEEGMNGAWACVSYRKGCWGWILPNKRITILSLGNTILFLVSCAVLHCLIKEKYKNLSDDLISALVRLFCLVSDENIRQALQNYFCGFSSQLLFPSYCHI